MTSVASKILYNGNTTAVYQWDAYIASSDTAVLGLGEIAWMVDQTRFLPVINVQGTENARSHIGLYGTNDVKLSFQTTSINLGRAFMTADVQGAATIRANAFGSIAGGAGGNLHVEMSGGGSVTPIGSFGNASLLDIYPVNGGYGVVTGAQVQAAEGGRIEIWTDVVGTNTFSAIQGPERYGTATIVMGGGHSVSADTTINVTRNSLTLWDTMTFMGLIHSDNAFSISLGNFRAASYDIDKAAGTFNFYDANGGLQKALRLDGVVPNYVSQTASGIIMTRDPPQGGVLLAPHIG